MEVQPPVGKSDRPISVIIPTLNESSWLKGTLEAIGSLKRVQEVIVVDGASDDSTLTVARECGVRVCQSDRGRGVQMHAGAQLARGDVLWFLHADTHPSANADECILSALADMSVSGGHFQIGFDGSTTPARFLTWLYPNLRRIGLCYGDSGFFARRAAYESVGGFRPFPIFEDLDLLRRLRRQGRFVRLTARVTASSRRFEGRSFCLTFGRWTLLQILYWTGAPPKILGRFYAPIRHAGSGAKSLEPVPSTGRLDSPRVASKAKMTG